MSRRAPFRRHARLLLCDLRSLIAALLDEPMLAAHGILLAAHWTMEKRLNETT
jgi:hypothetical protein